MGAIKHYMMELADKLGKDFEEVTNEDIQNELFNQAQELFSNGSYSQNELDGMKQFLPTKKATEIKSGNVDEIFMDNTGTFYLIVA